MKKKQADGLRPPTRMDRMIRERVHDPYKTRLKLPDPTVCPQCGAVYREARWHWAEAPAGANERTCQACHRIRDKFPAGTVTLSGDFVTKHEAEILNLARNQEKVENQEHPLHRIMGIRTRPGRIAIDTTDIHLPRRIGEAIHRAFEGELDFHYEEETYRIRVTWRRDA